MTLPARSLLVVLLVTLLLSVPTAGHYVGLIYYPPALDAEESLYVAGTDGVVYALTAEGRLRWTYDASAELTAPAVVADGTVAVGTADGRVVGLRTDDGTVRWERRVRSGTEQSWIASLAAGTRGVYATTGRAVHALDPDDGTVRWRLDVSGRVLEPPAVAEDRVHVAAERGGTSVVYAISPDGERRWNRTYGGSAGAPAVGPDGAVYVEVGDRLRAVSPDGTERWSVHVGDSAAPPAVAGSRVVVGTFGGDLVAVEDGTVVREYAVGAAVAPAFGPDGERVYAVTPESLIAVGDGDRRVTTRIGATVLMPPTVGEHVYVGTQLNRTYALAPDGSIAWIGRYATGPGTTLEPAHEVEPPAFLDDAAGDPTRVIPPDAAELPLDTARGASGRDGSLPTGAAGVAVVLVVLIAAAGLRH